VAGEGKLQRLGQLRDGREGSRDALWDVLRPHLIVEGQAVVEKIRQVDQQGGIR